MQAGKTAEQQDELAALFPAPRPIMIAGRLIEVSRVGLSRVLQLAQFLFPAYSDLPAFLASLDDSPADSASLIVAATGVDPQWALALDSVDRLAIVVEIVEINNDVFLQALPLLTRLTTALNRLGGDGPMQSSISPAVDSPMSDDSLPPLSASLSKQPRALNNESVQRA